VTAPVEVGNLADSTGSIGSIRSVLVANRGEIVVRVCRTLAALGIRSIAIYAPDDSGAPHTSVADVAVAVDGYLDVDSIVAAAKAASADAVHPGYGFLSEDPGFARAVVGAGLVWVGPPPEAIEAMGDKIRAKETVAAAGVPVVPGAGRPGMDDDSLAAAALEVGLPVLLKPAAGGGGKGMRRVADASDLGPSIAAARREAQGAFGDSTLLVERWIDRPRHVEVQVFADTLGNMVTLGERECSLQRRHQKIVEETPSPLLDATTRAAMTKSALDVASSCGYVGAGTVEFIVSDDRPDEYFFMEMNTRLQVEHPVTEAVTGVDLVEWQLRVAAGEALPVAQDAVFSRGHAVEVRVYAEDPVRGFLPASGAVALVALPTGRSHVRVDSALTRGSVVGTRYDPMLAKVVAWGETRDEALDRLRAALEETAVLGVTTNVGYLTRLLAHRDVVAGRLDTGLVDRTLGELAAPDEVESRDAAVVAACRLAISLEPPSPEPTGTFIDPWELRDGWSVGGPREWNAAFLRDGHKVSVTVRGHVRNGRDGATLRVDDGPSLRVRAVAAAGGPGPAQPDARLSVTIDGATAMWLAATQGDDIWVSRGGDAWRFGPDRAARGEAGVIAGAAGPVRSPMPGVVVAVHVSAGNAVHAGQPLLAVEAMKMEHTVVAPVDGVVAELLVRTGQTVGLDELLARVESGGSVACAAGTGPGLGVLDDDDVGEQEAGL
jgi:acetyl-CoA/propionyl-CoA carboxylase biotin carboxyl carrier protein